MPASPLPPPPPAVVNQSECPTEWRELWAEQTSWSFIAVVTVLLFLGVMGCFVCAVFLARRTLARQHQTRSSQLFVRNLGSPPQLKLPQECKWHLFLSHTWANGQDQCAKIKTGLRLCVRKMKIFLDVDDLEDLQFLERDVKSTAVVMLFLTKSYFKSANCQRELRASEREDKPLILLRETAPSKGGLLVPALIEECPEELRAFVFREDRLKQMVPFYRHERVWAVTLQQIASMVVGYCAHTIELKLWRASQSAQASMGAKSRRSSHGQSGRPSLGIGRLSRGQSIKRLSGGHGRPGIGTCVNLIRGVDSNRLRLLGSRTSSASSASSVSSASAPGQAIAAVAAAASRAKGGGEAGDGEAAQAERPIKVNTWRLRAAEALRAEMEAAEAEERAAAEGGAEVSYDGDGGSDDRGEAGGGDGGRCPPAPAPAAAAPAPAASAAAPAPAACPAAAPPPAPAAARASTQSPRTPPRRRSGAAEPSAGVMEAPRDPSPRSAQREWVCNEEDRMSRDEGRSDA